MNTAIRWRIITLQSILVLVLAGASGFAFYEGNFVTNMITSELVAQHISFPSAQALAKDPEAAKYGSDFSQYAGQQVDNGDKARAYANDFIAVHLEGVANGKTYSQVSAQTFVIGAQIAATSKDDPNYASLQTQMATAQGQVATLFKGETLRSMLLNAYGWYTFATYATYAGIGLLLATLAMLGALVFELFVAGRKPQTLRVAQKVAA